MARRGRPPKKESRVDDVVRLRRQAGEHFLRASAFLLDWHHHRDNVAAALFYADLGLLRLAQSDAGMEVHDRVLEFIQQFREPPRPPVVPVGTGL